MNVERSDVVVVPKAGLRLKRASNPDVGGGGGGYSQSPLSSPRSPGPYFQLPSPIITRRTRTYSASERAANTPSVTGRVKYFCRNKGHGYVTPDDGGEDLFLHVSDVDGEFVPREGDTVSFRICPVPPKNERMQAVHAVILNMAPGTHEKWDVPGSPGAFRNGARSPIFD